MAKHILTPLPKLAGQQAAASHPDNQIRLSASAGTGKTQVLTARVMRLLIAGVKPESILCLTFTKAGAAEMADRIHERLGAWVTMRDSELSTDLSGLGESIDPIQLMKARTLFAKVLEARGSGLRIQTIHSFCQTLLASFPAEARLPPGFRPVEGREEDQLAAKALADMVEGFDREGRTDDMDRLRGLAKRLSEDATRAFLRRCASDPDAMKALPNGEGVLPFIRRAITGIDDIEDVLATVCDEGGFDRASLEMLRDMLGNWRTKAGTPHMEGQKSATRIARWIAVSSEDRRELLEELRTAWLTGAGTWRAKEPDDPDYRPTAERLDSWIARLIELQRGAKIAPMIANALMIGRDYAHAYADAKRTAGVVDFNDMIRSTVRLLKTPGIGDWIKFKLDQSVDHILVDEAQDTNAAQWDIVKALAEEFFAGEGAKGERVRTLFTVGDFKQAIFGFQGTDPRQFDDAGKYFAALAAAADQDIQHLSLSDSFRSSQPVLDLTDAVLGALGHEALGLPDVPDLHRSAKKGSGSVMLLPPVSSAAVAEDDDEEADEPEAVSDAELKWAKQLAERLRNWTEGGLQLRNQDRIVEPGDIMILVRSRGELARLIVSRLYEAGVPVAGVDRLRLGAPIAVQDLLACVRFALQPRDDLSLAALLVSPLVGWTQDQLYDRAKGRTGDLWQHLGDHKPEELILIRNMADRSTPYQFLETILSGDIRGRQKLIARLGEEARDPIEALLSAALDFEQQAMPSLQLFLDWFDRDDVEIKRDPAKPENAVRVMTVHGAKGLQAPVVVLADATSDPGFKRKTDLKWEVEPGRVIPLFRPKKEEQAGSLKTSVEAQDARETQEHWRLLYVAMTRAEEHLVIGGALGRKQQKLGLSDRCWHFRVAEALTATGRVRDADGALILEHQDPIGRKSKQDTAIETWPGDLPEWAVLSAAAEAKPPRPLAPSRAEVLDEEASPPPSADMRRAARRGILLHSLFERLPAVPRADRARAAATWLEHAAGVGDAGQRQQLITDALGVIEHPEFADIFAGDALAEVPLAGVVNGRVIAGAVDRLLVRDDDVLVVDFKTGRRVPGNAAAVSVHHKAQMAAYVAVLEGIFPGRTVRAALLYSTGPALIILPPEMVEAHKPGFSDAQEDLSAPR